MNDGMNECALRMRTLYLVATENTKQLKWNSESIPWHRDVFSRIKIYFLICASAYLPRIVITYRMKSFSLFTELTKKKKLKTGHFTIHLHIRFGHWECYPLKVCYVFVAIRTNHWNSIRRQQIHRRNVLDRIQTKMGYQYLQDAALAMSAMSSLGNCRIPLDGKFQRQHRCPHKI